MAPRTRPPADPAQVQEAAAVVERIVGRGFQLFHTRRMGWLLRQMEFWPTPSGIDRMTFVDVDQAPEGQLGALLLRHLERQRTGRP